jgi:hypothetical protein
MRINPPSTVMDGAAMDPRQRPYTDLVCQPMLEAMDVCVRMVRSEAGMRSGR